MGAGPGRRPSLCASRVFVIGDAPRTRARQANGALGAGAGSGPGRGWPARLCVSGERVAVRRRSTAPARASPALRGPPRAAPAACSRLSPASSRRSRPLSPPSPSPFSERTDPAAGGSRLSARFSPGVLIRAGAGAGAGGVGESHSGAATGRLGEPGVFCKSVSRPPPHPRLAPPAPPPPINKKYQLFGHKEERCPQNAPSRPPRQDPGAQRPMPGAARPGSERAWEASAGGRRAAGCGAPGERRGPSGRTGRDRPACRGWRRGPGRWGSGWGRPCEGRRDRGQAFTRVSSLPPQRCRGAGCRPPSRPTGSSR